MTDNTHPEALRLADMLTADEWPGHVTLVSYARECVAELRRQHARITEMEAQLEAIGAGGVSGPLMGEQSAQKVSDAQRALHELILNRLSHAELLEKAHYLMELNSNQGRTISELQDLAALTAQAPSQLGGFDAGDMASAAAQGYRDGWTAAQAISAEPTPDELRAIAREARNSSGSASDDCGSAAYVLYGWRAAMSKVATRPAPPAMDGGEDAARWRDWSQALAEASAAPAPEDTVFMKAFADAIGDSDAPFTAEQFTSWVDAARKQGANHD